jgi:hypothetical protein
MTGFRSLGLMLTIALSTPALAAAADDQQVVYWPLVTDGQEHRRVAYPAEAGSIVVLADSTVVLEAREAAVSWWPITREYLSDVSRSAPVVAGTLEIVDESGRAITVTPEPYLVWHPDGAGAGKSEIVRGPAAATVYEDYVAKGRAAAEAAQLHQRLVAEHHAAVEAWLKLAAQKPPQLPPPPPEFTIPEPEPYHAFATAPETAAVVSLPAGTYTVRLRDAGGSVVAGSERRLVSFAPRATGVGYVVRPGDRWTQPAISFSPQETIYTTGNSALYIQPVPVAEYGAQHFTRLFQPQTVEQVDPFPSIWVPQGAELADDQQADLVIRDGAERLAAAPTTGFRVAQRPGVARGYVIEKFEPAAGGALKPDFFAMEIPQGTIATSIDLEAGDTALPASERRVRTVNPAADPVLFIPALLPIVIGVLFHLLRSRKRPNRLPATPIPRAGTA